MQVLAAHHVGNLEPGWPFITPESQHEMYHRAILNVVVSEHIVVIQLLASEDQTRLTDWDTFRYLDQGFQGVDCV